MRIFIAGCIFRKALVVKDELCCYAEKAGLYVLTQTSEGGVALANRKNFKAKEFKFS